MRVYLLGYFGSGAYADDLIGEVTRQMFREVAGPNVTLHDRTTHPVPSTGTQVAEFLNRYDLIVFCGGSLLGRLRLAPFHRLENWIDQLKPPLVILGTGWRAETEPLADTERMRMLRLLDRTTAIYVRGQNTARQLRDLTDKPVMALGDPGLCWTRQEPLRPAAVRRIGVVVRQMEPVEITQDRATIPNERFHRRMAKILDYIGETEQAEIVFVPMASVDRPTDNDFQAAERVGNFMQWDSWVYTMHGTVPAHDLQSVARALGQMDLVISQRLHGTLISVAQGVPVMPIEYQFGKMDDSLSIPGLERLRALITPMADFGAGAYQEKRTRLIDPDLVAANSAACRAIRGRYRQVVSTIV